MTEGYRKPPKKTQFKKRSIGQSEGATESEHAAGFGSIHIS